MGQLSALVLLFALLMQPSAAPPAFQNLAPATPNHEYNQLTREQQFEIRRKDFASGRDMLLRRGVPFDPDELLRENWRQKLRGVLATMPEMKGTRYETAPLNGVYLVDTLYLPEKTEVAGDTVILASYLVFEGKNPVVKGPHDLHVFPVFRTAVLGMSLSQALQKAGLPVVQEKSALPSFAAIQHRLKIEPHPLITFDTSGLGPKTTRDPKYHR